MCHSICSCTEEKNLTHFLKLAAVLVLFSSIVFGQSAGKTRDYYIAADEVDWDYAPGGVNKMMGMKFDGYSTVFTERGPHRIGTVYRKCRRDSGGDGWLGSPASHVATS